MKFVNLSTIQRFQNKIFEELFGFSWLDLLGQSWKLLRKLARGMADEGIYEVRTYESRLEILDAKGKQAKFTKRERVRYLQNHIVAYQDHAWGDGEILRNYQCTPGVVVDQYRPGQTTFLLISLRKEKQRGDEDEFNIEWEMRDSFVRSREMWETQVKHKTRQLQVQIVFPKSRPPQRVWVEEVLRRRRTYLGHSNFVKLSSGRFQVTWQTKKPQLNERYQIHWEW